MQNHFKVSCRCATYNHAAYIEDTFRGFCDQKTTFPYVCVVVDDASTDGEQEVINKYLKDNFDIINQRVTWRDETKDYNFIISQHLSNKNCYFAVYFLKYNHYQSGKTRYPYFKKWVEKSEYSASCEGDDYWIDNTKLQKQADYLDAHKDCSGVFSNIILRNEKDEQITESKIYFEKEKYTIKDVYKGVVFPINSLCLRTEVWLQTNSIELKAHGDFKQAYASGLNGYVHHMNEFFSVYRKTGKGMSSQWDAKTQLIHDINEWYGLFKQLGFPDKTRHSLFQTKLINDFVYNHGLKNFPFHDIKNSLFMSKWCVYLVGSFFYPFKRAYKSLVIRINKRHGER